MATVQIVVSKVKKKQIESFAKTEHRSVSNMAAWLLELGTQKYFEEKTAKSGKG
jgi:hypothetical protein